ncbi:MAG: zinc ABC transporter substrate-binding protein [Clostridia bacterium]|nr:zinc ABC transporter substrate-binding protein [Clostridia bacterium]
MKRFCLIILALTLLLGMTAALCGCDGAKDLTADGSGITIAVTSPAAHALVSPLTVNYTEDGGSNVVTIVPLYKPGQDIHSFEPAAKDIISLAGADVVVCTGSETWLDSALSSSGNTAARVVSMMEACDIHAAEHDHDHSSEDSACALIGNDEHVWLAVDYATLIVAAVTNTLKEADPDNASVWDKHGETFKTELIALNTEFHEAVRSSAKKTVVVADRHPFVYLFSHLGLDCVAAFPGCSSETSASFETQTKLIEAVKSGELAYIFVIEGSDRKVAEVIAKETGAEILTLNSMQVVSDYGSIDYLKVMRDNLENLKKALQ